MKTKSFKCPKTCWRMLVHFKVCTNWSESLLFTGGLVPGCVVGGDVERGAGRGGQRETEAVAASWTSTAATGGPHVSRQTATIFSSSLFHRRVLGGESVRFGNPVSQAWAKINSERDHLPTSPSLIPSLSHRWCVLPRAEGGLSGIGGTSLPAVPGLRNSRTPKYIISPISLSQHNQRRYYMKLLQDILIARQVSSLNVTCLDDKTLTY